MHNTLDLNQEIQRKLIHLSSSIIPILIAAYGKDTMLPYLLLLAILFPLLDYLRLNNFYLKFIYNKMFFNVTRNHEQRTITGASWVFIGAGLTLLIYTDIVSIISLLVMSISDSVAALFGMKFGKTKLFNKSLEGTMAFFAMTSIIVFTLSPLKFSINIIAIATATIVELLSGPKFNDNLMIPLFIGLILTISGI